MCHCEFYICNIMTIKIVILIKAIVPCTIVHKKLVYHYIYFIKMPSDIMNS